ncbi:TIGR02757 family protein [Mangrovibacterium lignilyticum]|uniref:TIGR02757 family protein n=1 Tax=Mangrovibacterium lignilyticum TaxID=2668052 RepID=UPI0013D6DA0F|nr:TIGR02757 family protein [Mangrovibacterium lignilyticum]
MAKSNPKIDVTDRLAFSEIFELLEEKARQYNCVDFIATDPIQIPRQFAQKENIEIAGFLAATIAWGQRPTIIKNGKWLMEAMDHDPYAFLLNTNEDEWLHFEGFKHRTFNGVDCLFFLRSLKNIYQNHGGLEAVFTHGYEQEGAVSGALRYFRKVFFEVEGDRRTHKHVSNIDKGASAKRLNMYLRWMVRKDDAGVDFGIWNGIPASELLLPLDVHTSKQARQLGLLTRKQDDWKAVLEVTEHLKAFDPNDPIKYDFALFGLGAFTQL